MKKSLTPPTNTESINISDFKARMLSLVEDTRDHGKEFILLKHGQPIARVVPMDRPKSFMEIAGSLADKLSIKGDIINFDTSGDWKSLK